MAIKKQEFYEGAALHVLVRGGEIESVKYDPPFFFFNNRFSVLLKHCGRGRTPWGFTFGTDEQKKLRKKATEFKVVIGLICGADGIAGFSYEDFLEIVPRGSSASHVACYRKHGEYYEVSGPGGTLHAKVPPSNWQKILAS